MRAYFEIMKINLKNSLVYRLDSFIGILGSIISLFIQIYLWKALLGDSTVKGINLQDMVTYQTIGILFRIFYDNTVAREVGGKVMDGSIAMILIKPYNFALSMFAGTLGKMTSGFVRTGLPVIAIIVLTTGFKIKVTPLNAVVFIIVVIMNIFLNWLIYYIIGLIHFVLVSAKWFSKIMGDVIRIFGGGIMPLWFFPGVLKKISFYLPFQLLYQFPQSLFINKISSEEIIFNIIIEVVWITILSCIAKFLWFIGIRKLVIQGG